MKPLKDIKERIDTDPKGTQRGGLLGFYESGLRRFKTLGSLLVLIPMYGVGIFCLGLSFTPGAIALLWGFQALQNQNLYVQGAGFAFLVAMAYMLSGFFLIMVVPAVNFIMRTYPRPWRGPYYSLQTVHWAIHNALTYLPRYTFLELMTPTPFNLLFYRLMGMKIGKGTQINTTHISDPCLIELGEKVTIGGSATLLAHYGQAGFLVIAPVKIGSGSTIGLRATIMGDVEIGENVKILPNSVVLPKTRIPSGETWGGVPAQKIEFKVNKDRQSA